MKNWKAVFHHFHQEPMLEMLPVQSKGLIPSISRFTAISALNLKSLLSLSPTVVFLPAEMDRITLDSFGLNTTTFLANTPPLHTTTPHLCPFELEIKMADEHEIFLKCRRIAPELIADFEKPCFSLELEIFKSMTTDGESAPAVETPSMSEISNQDGNRIAECEGKSNSQELEDFISAQK